MAITEIASPYSIFRIGTSEIGFGVTFKLAGSLNVQNFSVHAVDGIVFIPSAM